MTIAETPPNSEPVDRDDHRRHLRPSRACSSGRLRAAIVRGGGAGRADAERLRGDRAARGLLRRRAVADWQRRRSEYQQGRVPARKLRQRQEPLHGGADPAAAPQRGCPFDPPACRRRREVQRLDHRPSVPGRAVPHDRGNRHGVGNSRALCRTRASNSPESADARVLPGRPLVRGRAEPARQHGRCSILPHAERKGSGRLRQWRRRMGRSRERMGRDRIRSGPRSTSRRRRTPALGRRSHRCLLQRRSHRRRDERRALRSARRGLERHVPARAGPRLRRPDPVPRRAGPVAREPRRGHRIRQPGGTEGREARGGHAIRPSDSDRELHRAPARPARAGG